MPIGISTKAEDEPTLISVSSARDEFQFGWEQASFTILFLLTCVHLHSI
jgi:hypothetical protein